MSDDSSQGNQSDEITAGHLEHIALFPLPGAVFFPHTMLPLHIFEPRYQELADEALEDGVPIAVVKLLEPRRQDAQGRPAYHAVGGAGFIAHHQLLPDGRYNILLEGIARVRILEEIESDRPYRVGRAELVPDVHDPHGAIGALLTTLRGCIVGLRGDYERLAEALVKALNTVEQPGALSNAIASMLISEPEARQQLLEQPRVAERLDAIITRLTDLLATTGDPGGGGWLN